MLLARIFIPCLKQNWHSYRWGEYLGYMDLTFDKEGKIVSYQGAPIHLDNTTAQEPELQAEVDEWRVPFDEYGKQVVASTVQVLDQTACQLSECTLGDLISDATLAYHHNVTAGADAALFNAGGSSLYSSIFVSADRSQVSVHPSTPEMFVLSCLDFNLN